MESKRRKFEVGQRVWTFDVNRRRYTKPEPGHMWGDIIYEEHFEPYAVTRIEGRSYVICNGNGFEHKVSFLAAQTRLYSDKDREGNIWLRSHKHKVVRLVECCNDADVIRQIAALVGYSAPDAKGGE